jgi:hypothetical protein
MNRVFTPLNPSHRASPRFWKTHVGGGGGQKDCALAVTWEVLEQSPGSLRLVRYVVTYDFHAI